MYYDNVIISQTIKLQRCKVASVKLRLKANGCNVQSPNSGY